MAHLAQCVHSCHVVRICELVYLSFDTFDIWFCLEHSYHSTTTLPHTDAGHARGAHTHVVGRCTTTVGVKSYQTTRRDCPLSQIACVQKLRLCHPPHDCQNHRCAMLGHGGCGNEHSCSAAAAANHTQPPIRAAQSERTPRCREQRRRGGRTGKGEQCLTCFPGPHIREW